MQVVRLGVVVEVGVGGVPASAAAGAPDPEVGALALELGEVLVVSANAQAKTVAAPQPCEPPSTDCR